MGRLTKNPHLAPNAGVAASGLMPGGTTAERPDTTKDGQMRYNATNTAMEYWDGTAWEQFGQTGLSTVTADSLTGADGARVLFNATQGVTITIAAATDVLVFVGGVYQTPTTNYTVSGFDITFTSAPPNLESITVLHGFNEVT